MVFNTNYELCKVLSGLSQDEILNTPEFFAMSQADVIRHPRCPDHLRRVLFEMPWTGRPNFVQVRPQDFRSKLVPILGTAWHVDVNTPLENGRMNWAKDLAEFRSMVVSFGEVVETEFARGPIEVPPSVDPMDHPQFAGFIESLKPEIIRLAPNQIATYTSMDAHRVGTNYRLGRARLIIVTVECDRPLEKDAGSVRWSIAERP